MDIFLNFRRQSYDKTYYQDLDTYISRIYSNHMLLSAIAGPLIIYTQYNRFKMIADTTFIMKKIFASAIFYIVLVILAVLVRKYKSRLEKCEKFWRLVFDLFYNVLCGYVAYQNWEIDKYEIDSSVRYYWAWWDCLVVSMMLGPVSRWYLKSSAFFIVSSQMGMCYYYYTGNSSVIVCTIQICLLILTTSYMTERCNKRKFIEKQKIYEEAEAVKEIMEHTTDGVTIYSVQKTVLFRNWDGEKFKWWDSEKTAQDNLLQVKIQHKTIMSKCLKAAVGLDWKVTNLLEVLNFIADKVRKSSENKPHICIKEIEESGHQTRSLMTLSTIVTRTNPETEASETCQIEVRIMSLIFQGAPSLALIFTDITERNMLATLEDNNNYKNRLLASVSHELRTPLNASINFIQAAIDDPHIPEKIRDTYLVPSIRSNQLLLYLINDILDFSQMTANKLRLVYENNSIKKTISECLNLIKIQATRKGLALEVDYDIQTPNADLCTDHNRLRQIILNLLSNALKFTLKGEIRIKAKLEFSKNYGKILEVAVTDTGIGISTENQDKLFKAFEKIELGDRASINSTGVGLGLVISNNLVSMLNMEQENAGLKVESEANKGTTFSFWITEHSIYNSATSLEDLAKSENPEDYNLFMSETARTDSPDSDSRQSRPIYSRQISAGNEVLSRTSFDDDMLADEHCPSILVVDDDIFNITALETILKKLGYSCDSVFNGVQAIEKVKERKEKACDKGCSGYKLVFMDYNMPLMDGFEATKKLKELVNLGVVDKMTIIGCTAFSQDAEKERGRESGMDGQCIKPLSLDKLNNVLSKYMLPITSSKSF